MIQLEKAPLITIEWSWRYFYFAKFRGANFRRFQVGWLVVMTRAAWLEQAKPYSAVGDRDTNPTSTA